MKNKIDMQELDNKLIRLGFRDNIAGTQMIRVAVQEWYPGISMTKELYPAIAEELHSTASRVERAMRHAITTAFDRGSVSTINSLFGYTISAEKGTPTVGEFVARMARVCAVED